MNRPYAIFDMDGTLVDSMCYWRNMEREFLTRKGVTDNLEEILEATKPMTLAEFSAYFSKICGVEFTPEQLIAECEEIMAEHYRNDVQIKPGVREYLDALQQKGVPMCVASATNKPLVELCLEKLGLRPYFRFILSCVEVGAGKSRPDVFLEAARRLGGEPADCAVYEDAIYAVRSAHAAGFYVVAVKDEHNGASWDEMRETADEILENW